jgi:curved DNA-binding protein CbpA
MESLQDLCDYYAVLGVPRHAEPDQIKAAFHAAALQSHPDKLGSAKSDGSSARRGAGGGRSGDVRQARTLHPRAAAANATAGFQALQDAWQVGRWQRV